MVIDLSVLNGLKTYVSIGLYVIYHASVTHGWIQPNPDIELFIQGSIAASFAHKVSKLTTPGETK